MPRLKGPLHSEYRRPARNLHDQNRGTKNTGEGFSDLAEVLDLYDFMVERDGLPSVEDREQMVDEWMGKWPCNCRSWLRHKLGLGAARTERLNA